MAGPAVKRHKKTETIRIGQTRKPGQAKAQFLQVMKEEVRDFASDTIVLAARQQYRSQKSLPNQMAYDRTAKLFDLTEAQAKRIVGMNVDTEGLAGFQRNIRFFYTDMDVLARAFVVAYTRLIQLTRTDSGASVGSYYMWCRDPGDVGRTGKIKSPSKVVKWIRESTHPLTKVTILGPLTEYRRSVIYNPAGRKQQTQVVSQSRGYNKGAATDRYKFTKGTKSKIDKKKVTSTIKISHAKRRSGKVYHSVQVAKSIQWMVRQELRRNFRGIYTAYRFVPSKEPLKLYKTPPQTWKPDGENRHIPALSIGLRSTSSEGGLGGFKNKGTIKG